MSRQGMQQPDGRQPRAAHLLSRHPDQDCPITLMLHQHLKGRNIKQYLGQRLPIILVMHQLHQPIPEVQHLPCRHLNCHRMTIQLQLHWHTISSLVTLLTRRLNSTGLSYCSACSSPCSFKHVRAPWCGNCVSICSLIAHSHRW